MSQSNLLAALDNLGAAIKEDAAERGIRGYHRTAETLPKGVTCAIRRMSDQEACSTCGLAWDVNDPDPPACPRGR